MHPIFEGYDVMRFVVLMLALPTMAQEFELDLSEPKTPPKFRPSLALISVSAEDPDSTARAQLLEQDLARLVGQSDQFSSIVEPTVAKSKLEGDYPAASGCDGWACFDSALKKLESQRGLTVRVRKTNGGSVVSVRAFDPALPETVAAEKEILDKVEAAARFAGVKGKSQLEKDKDFAKRASIEVMGIINQLDTPNGELVVDCPEQTATVSIDGQPIGTGTSSKVVSRGAHTVKVTAGEFLPFEQTVSVEPMKEATVRVTLVAKPIERPAVAVVTNEYPPLLSRPGLYVAGVGAVVAIVGLVLGASAVGVQNQAKDGNGDGALDVTRAQAQGAQTNATLANILVPAGAAAMAGGLIWVAVTPPLRTAAPATATPPPTTTEGGGGFGVTVGGRF
jgi:hypothetical protein